MLINSEINVGQMMSYLSATQMIQRSFTQMSILFGQALRGLSIFNINICWLDFYII